MYKCKERFILRIKREKIMTTEELTTMYANTKDLDKKTAIIRYAEKLAEQGK